jgi:hypothetical protein
MTMMRILVLMPRLLELPSLAASVRLVVTMFQVLHAMVLKCEFAVQTQIAVMLVSEVAVDVEELLQRELYMKAPVSSMVASVIA